MENIYEQLEISEQGRHISIPKDAAEFIFDFLKDKPISQTLETGFAYGCSAAHIISATGKNHIAIDPYEKESFNDLGVYNIKKTRPGKIFEIYQIAFTNCFAEPAE